MFEYKYKLPKNEIKTTYGSIKITNIIFDPYEIEKELPNIVFDDENLKHMFAEKNLSKSKRANIYKRFIPKIDTPTDWEEFVEKCILENRTFYSFLAEGILGLVFRDIYNYNLAKGVIDITETLSDTHTGVDACMYNLQEKNIILGEAKFYNNFNDGIKRIINDLTNKNIKNKLLSLQAKTENSDEAYQIVIKNLSLEGYSELTINEFMNQKITFAGFVLHSETDITQYDSQDFYDQYSISAKDLEQNICKSLELESIKGEYEIILVHLPIKSKKNLIVKIIDIAKEKLKNI